MGTENAMLAATLAEGPTVIRPAAREPEVDDLIAFLQKMGAEVERTDAGHDRGRGPAPSARCRAQRGRRPHRGGHVRGRGRHHRRRRQLANAPCEHLGAFIDVVGRGRRGGRLRRGHDRGTRCADRAVGRTRPRMSQQRRTLGSPRISSRRRPCCSARPVESATSTKQSSRIALNGWGNSAAWAPRSS